MQRSVSLLHRLVALHGQHRDLSLLDCQPSFALSERSAKGITLVNKISDCSEIASCCVASRVEGLPKSISGFTCETALDRRW